jgi:long-chain acyl-CoA synthetase
VACIYHTSSADEAKHILENSESKVVFCEGRRQMKTLEEIREDLPGLEHVVLFDVQKTHEKEENSEEGGPVSLEELVEGGEDVDDGQVDERVESVSPQDVFTLIYTSGTTGPPKGCILTHANYMTNIAQLEAVTDLGEDPTFFVFLPLAHTFTRMIQMVALSVGATLAYSSGDKDSLMEEIAEAQPTHFPAVPRIFEKIYNQAMAQVPEDGAKRKLFEKGVEVGREVANREHRGERVGPILKTEHKIADNEFFQDIRALFGGRLRMAQTGAAPVAKEMLEFFYACGVPIMEGYGATETSAVVSTNTPENLRFGTVGKPLEGVEVKVAEEDQEILVKGPNVFQGYNKNDEETSETLDEDGWLHTGDRGSIDEDGFLTIEGRLKDIIVTSSGKNVAASNIENRITESRWISQAVVYGDERPYLVALVTVDEDEREALAEKADMSGKVDAKAMTSDGSVRSEIQTVIDAANEDFADIEQVKKFTILERDLSEKEDELTPTMKVKRQKVYENHQELFDGLYDEGDEGGSE